MGAAVGALVAHNVAPERKFLRKAAPMPRFGPWVDTLALARRALPGRKEYGLGEVCAAVGLEGEVAARCPGRTWHDALFDAVAAGVFLSWLLGQEGWGELTVEDLASIRSRPMGRGQNRTKAERGIPREQGKSEKYTKYPVFHSISRHGEMNAG